MESITNKVLGSLARLLFAAWSVAAFAPVCADASDACIQDRPGVLLDSQVKDRIYDAVFDDRIALSVPEREPAPVDYGRYPMPAAAEPLTAAPVEKTTANAPIQVSRSFRHK